MQTDVALEQERLLLAERLLAGIERRHGLPHTSAYDLHPVAVDRYLVAYLPESREGAPAPQALEFAFTHSISDALELLRRVVTESPDGMGAACYVHDLNTGTSGPH